MNQQEIRFCSAADGVRPAGTIAHGFSVSFEGVARQSFSLVVRNIEEHDLACNFFAAESREFVKAVHGDHIRSQALCGSRRTTA